MDILVFIAMLILRKHTIIHFIIKELFRVSYICVARLNDFSGIYIYIYFMCGLFSLCIVFLANEFGLE